MEQIQPANKIIAPIQRPGIQAANTLTPKEVMAILHRHILLIISLTFLGAVAGCGLWFLFSRIAPAYTAQALIKVLPAVEKDPMSLAGAQVQKDIQYASRVSMADLIKQQNILVKLIERDKVQATKWFQSFGKNKDDRIRKAVKNLKDNFIVSPQRDGDYIILSMTCRDKKESADIVNEMMDLFLSSQGATTKEEVATKLSRLQDQLNRIQRDLDTAERSLDDVRKRWGFTDLDEHQFQHTITQKLNNLELEQNDLIMQIKEVQANIGNLRKQATGPINEQIEKLVETDPTMVFLAQQLALQEAQLAGLLAKFGENHQEVRHLQELITEVKTRRQFRQNEIAEQTRRSNLENAVDQLVVLQSRLEQLESMRQTAEAKNKELDLARAQYVQRVAVRDERKEMLASVKTQIEKLKMVHDDPGTPKVQSMGYAPEPLEISFPKLIIFLPAGTFLGFMLGVGLAFLLELLNEMVRTPKDVGRYLKLPLLGVIPQSDDDPMLDGSEIDFCHVVRHAPYSVSSEAYRQFRTNLKLFANGKSKKVFLVGSCNAEIGKTAVAANLASTLASENNKVLLVDANLWRPELHTVFARPQIDSQIATDSQIGLSNLLKGQCGVNEIIRSSDVEGLKIIDAGQLSAKPSLLLANYRMEELIKQLRENFDYIIVDGLPFLLVNESKLLARLVDGTILVFNAATTRRGAAQRTIRELKEINAEILGCVLFDIKVLKGGYFKEQFRSYKDYQKRLLMNPA